MKHLVLAFVLAATAAQADTITLDTTFSAYATQAGLDVELNPFNTSLGALIAASVEIRGSFSLGPYAVQSGTALATLSPGLLTGGWFGDLIFAQQTGLPVVNGKVIGAHNFTFDATRAVPSIYASAPWLTLFPYARMTGDDPVADFDPSAVYGIASVTYAYAPAAQDVPEPGSLFLLGSALTFVILRRRA